MLATRPARILSLGLLFGSALAAQVPSASDPPRYALPPKDIVIRGSCVLRLNHSHEAAVECIAGV